MTFTLHEMLLRRTCHLHVSAGRSLVSIHDFFTFLSDLDDLPDPLCCPVILTADDSRLVTVDDMILWDRWFILLWLWLFLGTSGVFSLFHSSVSFWWTQVRSLPAKPRTFLLSLVLSDITSNYNKETWVNLLDNTVPGKWCFCKLETTATDVVKPKNI